MDVANLGRRTRCGMVNTLLSSLQDSGDKSDEEEEEGRMLESFQKMVTLAGSLSDRAKMNMLEMFSRSGLGQMRPMMQPGNFNIFILIFCTISARNDAGHARDDDEPGSVLRSPQASSPARCRSSPASCTTCPCHQASAEPVSVSPG